MFLNLLQSVRKYIEMKTFFIGKICTVEFGVFLFKKVTSLLWRQSKDCIMWHSRGLRNHVRQ